ncbi:MAG TPA: hypothetical protein VK911_06770 [Vicinamibacterales bacterium]|nr:hypothetical protein [Vicinamibacterales bacterium]
MKRGLSTFVFAGLIVAGSPALAQTPIDPECAKLLPLATAEQLTKISPLVMLPFKQVPSAGGSCNYATKDSKVVFTVTIDHQRKAERMPRQFLVYKGGLAYGGGAGGKVAPVAGVGEEAFASANGVVFRKGLTIVAVQNDITSPASPRLSQPGLVDVARAIAGKL